MKRFVPMLMLFLAWAAPGCGAGDEDDLTTLTLADVSGMQPGNAVGSVFAGTYTSRTTQIDACRCRTGSCATIQPRTGVSRVVAQTDGTFTLDPGGGNACIGGIDGDGKFWCGYSWVRGGGAELSRQRGTFTLGSGAPTGFEIVAELTAAAPGFDCDLQVTSTHEYVGPVP